MSLSTSDLYPKRGNVLTFEIAYKRNLGALGLLMVSAQQPESLDCYKGVQRQSPHSVQEHVDRLNCRSHLRVRGPGLNIKHSEIPRSQVGCRIPKGSHAQDCG